MRCPFRYFDRTADIKQQHAATRLPTSSKSEENTVDGVPAVDSVMARVRLHCVQRQVRPHAHFADFDAHHAGFITESQFVRGVNSLVPSLPAASVRALVGEYTRRRAGAATLAWREFCVDVDKAFTLPQLERTPHAVVLPLRTTAQKLLTSTSMRHHLDTVLPALAQHAEAILGRISTSPHFDVAAHLRDFDRHNHGRVSATQFAQALSIGDVNMSPEEVAVLCGYYGDERGVHYRDVLADMRRHTSSPARGSQPTLTLALSQAKISPRKSTRLSQASDATETEVCCADVLQKVQVCVASEG